ncbi:indole-3-glycerol phosphate synthase TrpC [Candidatus Protochlamydia phocaeensis]|uniref:indole-3-glycerol phosphate synthase TrpC n=1 Tax=Candidatus Protochlamydia phocaeensis TaxID=1414722 RepID=UPI000838BD36|nr:indole-3-glycerol phosphate synthase TrpC [Candidatus Protochlamydia phocaeensis]
MSNHPYLDQILNRKRKEVQALIKRADQDPQNLLHQTLSQERKANGRFASALKGPKLGIIAEVKRRSPSVGKIGEIVDPAKLALNYCQGGASAISVLTDLGGFGGTLKDLQQVSQEISCSRAVVPVLRKDFIIHPLQLAEAALAGASAVLLIAGLLGKELKVFLEASVRLGLEALTEVHDVEDLELTLEAGAPIIGVNNRNLRTFEVDLKRSEELRPRIPPSAIAVAESGIRTPDQAKRMHELGYDAILVGEAFVQSKDPAALIALMRGEEHAN